VAFVVVVKFSTATRKIGGVIAHVRAGARRSGRTKTYGSVASGFGDPTLGRKEPSATCLWDGRPGRDSGGAKFTARPHIGTSACSDASAIAPRGHCTAGIGGVRNCGSPNGHVLGYCADATPRSSSSRQHQQASVSSASHRLFGTSVMRLPPLPSSRQER